MSKRIKKYYWAILLATITIVVMYYFGMNNVNFSEPYYIGFGQYLDIKAGILFVSLLVIGFIIWIIIFKRK